MPSSYGTIAETSFRRRFRALLATELLGFWRQGLFLALPAALVFAYAFPPLAVSAAALVMGMAAFSFCQPALSGMSSADFLLTRAVRRSDVFVVKTVVGAVLGLVVVMCAVTWTDWLPYVQDEWHVANAALAFPYFLMLYMTYWFLSALGVVVFNDTRSVIPAILLLPFVVAGAVIGWLWIATCDTGTFGLGAAIAYLIVGAAAVATGRFCFAAFSRMQSYGDMPVATSDEVAYLTSADAGSPRPGPAMRARVGSFPKKALPQKVRYLRPLMEVELALWSTVPGVFLLPMYSVVAVAPHGLFPLFALLFVAAYLNWVSTTARLSAHELLCVLPVPKRAHFRAKVAMNLLVLAAILSMLALVASLLPDRTITLPLTHRAAEALNAARSTEHSSEDGSGELFYIIGKGVYGYYTIPDARTANVLTRSAIAAIWYLLCWLVEAWPRSVGPRQLLLLLFSPFGLLIAFVLFGGVPISWVFVLAYKYPLYLIAGTVALCAVLYRFAQRRFLNFELVA